MIFKPKTITLKDGRTATFRPPCSADAAEMLDYLKQCASETDFIVRTPEEYTDTVEQQAVNLEKVRISDNNMKIVCIVDGRIAGCCQLFFNLRIKTKHRATIAISLRSEYWGLGIGSAMFEEMIAAAREHGVTLLELQYVEGNERGRALYEKFGFKAFGVLKGAFVMPDGRVLDEVYMAREI